VAISLSGIIPALTLTMSIVLFCSLAEPEKLAANIFSGQPQFTGHDITNTYMPYVNAGIGMTTSTVGLLAGMASGGAMAAPFAATAAAAAGAGARSTAATFPTMASAASAGSSRPQSTPPSKQLPPPQTKA
jgi:hypothetical protein